MLLARLTFVALVALVLDTARRRYEGAAYERAVVLQACQEARP